VILSPGLNKCVQRMC